MYKNDYNFNNEIHNRIKTVENYENFIEIINLYLETIRKKILITYDNYIELIKFCLR